MVVSVGIDVSKDKHDCFILNSEGEILSDVFTIPNSLDGFTILLQRIRDCSSSQDNIKVGLEATGHYSYNILGFLLDNGLPTYVLNPLRTNLLVIRSIEADERIFLPHEVSRLFCDERYKVVHILFSSPKMYILTTALPAGDRNRRIMLPAVSH